MHSLDELSHQITPARFHPDYEDRKPLHRPAVTHDWAIAERPFAVEYMAAQVGSLAEADVRAGVAAAEQAGALQKV